MSNDHMMETVLQYLSTVCIYPSVAAFKIGCNPPEAYLVNINLNIFFVFGSQAEWTSSMFFNINESTKYVSVWYWSTAHN